MEITELYDIKKIKKKISGKQARIKTVYELKDPVEIASLTQEIKLHRFSRKKTNKKTKRRNKKTHRRTWNTRYLPVFSNHLCPKKQF